MTELSPEQLKAKVNWLEACLDKMIWAKVAPMLHPDCRDEHTKAWAISQFKKQNFGEYK